MQHRISPGFPILETSTCGRGRFLGVNDEIPDVSPIRSEIRCFSISVGDEKCVRKRVLAKAVDGWRSVSGNLEGGGNECFPHQYFHLRALLVLCLLIAPAKTTMLCGMLSTNE